MNLEDHSVKTLTDEYDNFPIWSPRGELITFMRRIDGFFEICTIHPDGSDFKQLTLDPTIRAYVQAENDYCDRAFADSAALEAALFAEMRGRIKDDNSTVPTLDGPHAYYSRYRKNGQHPLCREPRELALSEGPQVADPSAGTAAAGAGDSAGARRADSTSWARPGTRPTIGCWRGRPTRPVRNSTPCGCA